MNQKTGKIKSLTSKDRGLDATLPERHSYSTPGRVQSSVRHLIVNYFCANYILNAWLSGMGAKHIHNKKNMQYTETFFILFG